MYKLEKTSILDTDNIYKEVICISPCPQSAELKKITKRYTNSRKLSRFKQQQQSCLDVLLNPTDMTEYISTSNIEYLISYLTQNSITINYQLTRLMQKSNPDLLFYIS